MTDEERDTLLIRIDERTNTIHDCLKGHIKHHWMVSIPVMMVLAGLLVALLTK